ncbi:aspartate kinase [Poriferisphaera sp. WC338]|uniref:aspartate kinase n=1 Tax=Poriferisphaera sp. WC338 TaxID=3425129 RepID=UPI003D813FA3
MGIKVCKFGGTSLADASQIKKVKTIVDADPDRKFVVPSAPGKRHADDQKVTDLLYLCHEHAKQGLAFDEVFKLIHQRYEQIIEDLGIDLDLSDELDRVKVGIAKYADRGADYAASRGEFLNGQIVAKLLGYRFIDAAEVIFFGENGRLDNQRTYEAFSQKISGDERAVVPGFYGTDHEGFVKTFSRGGSDVTGAIVSRGVGADVYENWTDVSGLLMADPRVVDHPKAIDMITYRELRELSYMGASVLHDEAVFPVREAGIPVNIRNTNKPEAAGTMIVATAKASSDMGSITGIAGRKDFTVIAVEKAMMNAEIGFGRRVLGVLERHGVSFEHMPSGIDTMSVVIADTELDGKLNDVLKEIEEDCDPDSVEAIDGMALIATVGRGMSHTPGMASKLFGALAEAGVNIRMIDQGSSELNIIVGVQASDFKTAVRAIYSRTVGV